MRYTIGTNLPQSIGVGWIRLVIALAPCALGCADDAGHKLAAQAGQSGKTANASADAAGSAGKTSAGMKAPPPPPDDGAPTWSGIYEYEFNSCRVMICHGGGIMGVVMADKRQAYDTLLNQPPAPLGQCVALGKQRVVPNQPDNSLMYLKLNSKSPCGQQMPPGGQLSQKARDRIRDWIMLGAQYD